MLSVKGTGAEKRLPKGRKIGPGGVEKTEPRLCEVRKGRAERLTEEKGLRESESSQEPGESEGGLGGKKLTQKN